MNFKPSWFSNENWVGTGPAIEREDGTKTWYVYGKRHRLDGPARECADGTKLWYIMGRKVSKPDVDSFRLKRLTLSFVVNRRIWKLFGTNNAKKVI